MTVVAALVLAGCSHASGSSGSQSSGSGTSGTAPATRPGGSGGTATLDVAGHSVRLTVQRCVDNGGSGVNITAVTPHTHDTLTVNVTKPIGASTLVYTTVSADNSFTNYSLASTVTKTKIAGEVQGTSVKLSGGGLAQAYDAHGKAAGGASHQQLSLEAACSSIQPMQPAAQPVTSSSPGPAHTRSATGTK